jgi:hypothetical protein
MSDASARKPNSMPAEIRDSVASGAIVSGAKADLSAASAVEQRPARDQVPRGRPELIAERQNGEAESMTSKMNS